MDNRPLVEMLFLFSKDAKVQTCVKFFEPRRHKVKEEQGGIPVKLTIDNCAIENIQYSISNIKYC